MSSTRILTQEGRPRLVRPDTARPRRFRGGVVTDPDAEARPVGHPFACQSWRVFEIRTGETVTLWTNAHGYDEVAS
jgi:hypothetical protein